MYESVKNNENKYTLKYKNEKQQMVEYASELFLSPMYFSTDAVLHLK